MNLTSGIGLVAVIVGALLAGFVVGRFTNDALAAGLLPRLDRYADLVAYVRARVIPYLAASEAVTIPAELRRLLARIDEMVPYDAEREKQKVEIMTWRAKGIQQEWSEAPEPRRYERRKQNG